MTKQALVSIFVALSLLTSAIYAVNDNAPPDKKVHYFIAGHGGIPLERRCVNERAFWGHL